MSATKLSATRVAAGEVRIDIRRAALVWLGAWFLGSLVASSVVAASGHDSSATAPTWVLLAAAACTWTPLVVGVVVLSRRFGTGSLGADYGLRFRAADLVGIPLGVACQVALVPALYWPLQRAWPATFGRDRVERSARDLAENAHGAWVLALVLVVVIGAPLVEELVYRGLLQGAVARRVHRVVAIVAVAAWFALVHFRPVEYPGLFAFGLVLGVLAMRTGRLGASVLAHVAFNATGLAMVW